MPSIRTLPFRHLLLGILFALSACASAPVQEMSEAERELEAGHYREARRNALGARAQAMRAREQAEQAPAENSEGM
jgi:hypothetical protein